MTIEILTSALEENRNFVFSCRKCANNPKAHQFANTQAANDSYEVKKEFLESITSDPSVLKERAVELKALQEEQKEEQIALEIEREQAERAAERIKFNRIIGETVDK
jgi:hypothetical protein